MTDSSEKFVPVFEGLGFGVRHLKHADVGVGVTVVEAVSVQGTFQLINPNYCISINYHIEVVQYPPTLNIFVLVGIIRYCAIKCKIRPIEQNLDYLSY